MIFNIIIIINNTWLINKPGKHFPTFKVLEILLIGAVLEPYQVGVVSSFASIS